MQDLSNYQDHTTTAEKIKRMMWNLVWCLFIRPIPRSLCNGWKLFIYRLFGARIDGTAKIYSSARVYAPWNLTLGAHSCLADGVNCYNQGVITIGKNTVISQGAYLCASGHDITQPDFPLISQPIIIKDQVWIATDAFIGPGVTIHKGAVVGARAAVFKDVEAWTVVGGNPAKEIKKRVIHA